jgi:hypothetical protein
LMEFGRDQKIVLSIGAIVVLMLFSRIEQATLLGMLVAATLMVLGLVVYSRPTCVIGMMIASGSAAASLGQQSLTVVGNLLNTGIGLIVPIYLLAWIALSAEEEPRPIVIRRGPALVTSVYAIVCLLSVGIVALTLGVVAPAVAISMSALMEIAIVLLTTIVGITILTFRDPRLADTGLTGEGSSTEETEGSTDN